MSPVVLHIHSGNLYGGIETVLTTLVCEDPGGAMAHQFGLCFDGRLAEELRAFGAPVHRLGEVRLCRPDSVRAARAALRRILDDVRPDVILTHLPWTHAVFGRVLRGAGCPVVQWVHGPITGVVGGLARLSPPDALICNSVYTQDTLPRAYRSIRSETIRYPLRAPAPAEPSARLAVRGSLSASADDVVILQASRLEPWKGHREHLRALARLAHDGRWVVWIAGGAQRPREAAYQRELRDLALALGIGGRVRFIGEHREMGSVMAAADVYCQPNSGPEPFGMTYVEALQAGLPVVASRSGAVPEIVGQETGLLLAAGDIEGLAHALGVLIGDTGRRLSLAANGPDRARALCDPRRQIERLRTYLDSARSRSAA